MGIMEHWLITQRILQEKVDILVLVVQVHKELVSHIKRHNKQHLQHLHGAFGLILLQTLTVMFLWVTEEPHL